MSDTIERCPICESLSYYEGKSGLDERAGDVCELCAASLNHYAMKFDASRGTNYFPVNTEIVECLEHSNIWNVLLVDTPFTVVKDGCNFVFQRLPAIPAKALRAAGYLKEQGE